MGEASFYERQPQEKVGADKLDTYNLGGHESTGFFIEDTGASGEGTACRRVDKKKQRRNST